MEGQTNSFSSKPLTDDARRKMRHELAQLQEQLAAGANGLDFPWERLKQLSGMELTGMLRLAGEPMRMIGAAYNSTLPTPMLSMLMIPLPVKSTPASALEEYCAGIDEAAQRKTAQMIDGMWEEAKKNADSNSDYPAICIAVYKIAVWLGMVRSGIKSRQWKPALLARYAIDISGVSRYNIDAPPNSTQFRMAVVEAFDFMASTHPRWTQGKTLPEGYGKFR